MDFETPASSGRTTAGYADFIQMSGCKGKIDISGCTFSNPHDDPINVHGTFNQVVEKIADNKIKVRYMHNETAGFPNFFVGDQVEFMIKGNMIPVADSVRTVVAVDGPDGRGGDMGEGSSSLTDIILLRQNRQRLRNPKLHRPVGNRRKWQRQRHIQRGNHGPQDNLLGFPVVKFCFHRTLSLVLFFP